MSITPTAIWRLETNPAGMKRRRLAVAVAAVLAGAGMAAVEAGLVGQPALADPVWLLLGALVVGYWGVFLHWVRR
jgi:hypothetical protein